MPAKASCEIKTRTVRQTQKNGDIYVIERKTQYDPAKKYNVVLSSRIVGKIPKGETSIVPTRPKRQAHEKASISGASDPPVDGSRLNVGMMYIIDHIGKTSGIDDAVYASTDKGTAEKIISLARYLIATNGQTFPGITTWQFKHPIPYEEGLSEDIYHDLFIMIGRNESLIQSFFAFRLSSLGRHALLAYDSTTISTYSEQLHEGQFGYNKAHDGLKTVKLLTLYSIENRQPVAFTKQPGSNPDVITIENALKQLQVLGITRAEIVTDNGYYSEKNLAELLHAHFNFITLIKVNIKWVKKELDSHLDEFRTAGSACPFDIKTHGITIMRMQEFSRARKYASTKKGLAEGEKETFSRRIYLHLFFNPTRRVEEDAKFDEDIFKLKALIEADASEEEISESGVKNARKFLHIRRYGSKCTVTFNEKLIAEEKKYHGYFALVSNCERDTFECLSKYRRRETIESFFKAEKQSADGNRTRVWSDDCLMGRMFVQFVALCYYEYLSEKLRQIKESLASEIDAPENETSETLKLKKKLLSWMKNRPVYLTLQWFDTMEEVTVSTKILSKRWTTEITARDKLFLKELGVPGF